MSDELTGQMVVFQFSSPFYTLSVFLVKFGCTICNYSFLACICSTAREEKANYMDFMRKVI